jgi:hypothetical protein
VILTVIVGLLTAAVIVVGLVQLLVFKRSAQHFDELRQTLATMERVVADSKGFTSDEGKEAERRLRDVIGRLRNRKVRRSAERVMERWKQAFASQPGPWIYNLSGPETEADRAHWKRGALHQERCDECLAAIEDTKGAMNRVERFATPSLR